MKFTITAVDCKADPDLDRLLTQLQNDIGLYGRLVYQFDIDGDTVRAHCYQKPRTSVEIDGLARCIPAYVCDVKAPDWILALDPPTVPTIIRKHNEALAEAEAVRQRAATTLARYLPAETEAA